MKSTILTFIGVVTIATMSIAQDQETNNIPRPWRQTLTECEENNEGGNVGTTVCYELTVEEATKYLNQLYDKRIGFIKSQLKAKSEYKNDTYDSLLVAQLNSFQQSREHFFKMREAQSEIARIQSFDGSGADGSKLWAMLELTEQQIIFIEETSTLDFYEIK